MTDKREKQTGVEGQPAYDPPQALRMGDVRAGAGGTACRQPGSGYSGNCQAGDVPDGDCLTVGGTALTCSTGNSAEIN
jgi:hypothetical protein